MPEPRAAILAVAAAVVGIAVSFARADPTPERTVRVIVGGATPQRTVRVLIGGATPVRSPRPTPTAVPEPPPAFGRVIYRAVKAGSYESLGIAMIMCRHRDREPRRFAFELFDMYGNKVTLFATSVVPSVPPGRKIVFVTDGTPFRNPDAKVRDLYDVRAAHMSGGVARVISDATIVHCMGKMRFDPGVGAKTYWRSMGIYREGVGATPAPVDW